MTKDRPKNVAASVRDRLLNIAREKSEDFQLILIRYALERLLFRLSRSNHRESFVLKGAMLFQIWSGESHRPTRDIDFLGYGEPSEKRFRDIFARLCNLEVDDDGLRFDAESIQVRTMKEEEKYQGIRIKLNAFLGAARIPVQVDIGFGDAITPSAVMIEYPTVLGFEAPTLSAYPRETVVAEKFQAMVMLGISNSRMKDFFDLWKLANDFEFQGNILSQAIQATFERRQTAVPDSAPLALTAEFTEDRQKKAQWNAFIRKSKLDVGARELIDIALRLQEFLLPPSIAASSRTVFEASWPKGGPWSTGS